NLDAQARAIWPQEVELFRRYGLAPDIRILDAGCGTGEVASRLAEFYPRSTVLGVDVLEERIEFARSRYDRLAPRLKFEARSVYELGLPDASFDLTVCRHVTHSIPHPDRVYAELKRVTRPGGRIHLIPEDYGMLHFETTAPNPREFWDEVPSKFGAATGTDLFIGRHTYRHLVNLGLEDITMDYVVVDTLRVPRDTFAAILTAWRDGYAELSAEHSRFSVAEATAYFNRMIANILDPAGYAVWMVPVMAARVPG
ncbi:MAG: class I SAM-dependent methyltransferase, partial [Candidatus Eiseniibacteriota bacterium]